MRCLTWIAALAALLLASGSAPAAEPACCEPLRNFFERIHPAGGWFPYGGGLLRWWEPCCFPCGGAPDDYCRKPLPCACWPPYPPYYIWGPPECCSPPCNGAPRPGNKP
jgi:hypothetical protein